MVLIEFSQPFRQYLEHLGYNEDRILDAANKAFRYKGKGVVIGLHKTASVLYEISDGDIGCEPYDMKIHAPAGVLYECLSGIELCGDLEFEYFDRMQNLLENR